MALPDALLSRLCRRDLSTRIAVIDDAFGPRQYGDWLDTARDLTHIVQTLSDRGYTVLPVNPWEESVEGLPCADNPAALEGPVHIAVFLSDPDISLGLMELLAEADCVWFQPGSSDDVLIDEARERFGMVGVGDICAEVAEIRFTLPWSATS